MNYIHQIEPYLTVAEQRAVGEYLRSGGWLTEHKATHDFEAQTKLILGAQYAVAVPNGTIGLYLALSAALPRTGCRIGVPAYTMVATINAVVWAGMTPVLLDIDPATGCLDPAALEKAEHLDGVLYVAINGRSGDMDQIVDICATKQIVLIEDACQAFMSAHMYQMCGTFGVVGVYSMSPHKVITTGQGGLVVTNDDQIYKKIKIMKDFGREKPGVDKHPYFGLNFKFTDLQAIIGIQQLNIINYRIRRKLQIFYRYAENLPKNMELLPLRPGNVPWFVDLLCADQATRDRLQQYLEEKKIGTRAFYPSLNQQPSLFEFSKKSYPNAEKFSARGLWLPSSIGLTDEQLDYIFTALNTFQ